MTRDDRRRRTRRSVWVAERLSRWVITVGGIGTILAVCLVAAFLVYVVVPLFQPASVGEGVLAGPPSPAAPVLRFAADDERTLAWSFHADGLLRVVRLDTGKILREERLPPSPLLTCAAFPAGSDRIALGFADGTFRLGRLGVESALVEPEALSAGAAASLGSGGRAEHEGALLVRTSQGQVRLERVVLELEEPQRAAPAGTPLALLDLVELASGPVAVTLDGAEALRLLTWTTQRNLLTGQETTRLEETLLPYQPDPRGRPAFLRLSGNGDQVYLAWADGWLRRYRIRTAGAVLAEERDLLVGAEAGLTGLEFLAGRATLLAGESSGSISAWFPVNREESETVDRTSLVRPHRFLGAPAAVVALAASVRSRIFVAGFADGSLLGFHATSRKRLARVAVGAGERIRAVAVAPKDDGLFVLTDDGIHSWAMDPGHPDASLASLFLPVWYEGYPRPEHVWQSSSMTDEAEPKLGLIPCVVGTLKATLYSLLFGVPLALLAAVFTSEFLHPRAKARVKPAIELMASLPSVILGFLAALVVAPFVEESVPTVLAAFFTLPLFLLLGAHLWQLLPRPKRLLAARFRMLWLAACLPAGLAAAAAAGPLAEGLLFGGDLKAWLAGRGGSGVGGWLIVLVPLCGAVVAAAAGRLLAPWTGRLVAAGGEAAAGRLFLVQFVLGALAALGLALVLGWGLDAAGWDPRGLFLGTYVQRNALIVGFIMGFAIIPIIYTLAEDALAAVPEHLRSASLAAGATPWQTAMRVVIPTAMSGLFSAVMIGLGRAVGETMIVLMAAGNTPILDMNIFNGFRTLSANIAVELPEAAVGSTHYRTLFLAALTLFAMTFVVNTLAEAVRLRFRRKVVDL